MYEVLILKRKTKEILFRIIFVINKALQATLNPACDCADELN